MSSQINIASMTGPVGSWIIDTGAIDHIVCDSSLFIDSKPISKAFVSLPNNQRVQVYAIKIVKLND